MQKGMKCLGKKTGSTVKIQMNEKKIKEKRKSLPRGWIVYQCLSGHVGIIDTNAF